MKFLYDGNTPTDSKSQGAGLESGCCLFSLVLIQVNQSDDSSDNTGIVSIFNNCLKGITLLDIGMQDGIKCLIIG